MSVGGDPPGVGTVSGQTDGRCNGALAYAGHRGWIDGDSAVKGEPTQSACLLSSSNPASSAMRSSSAGQM